MDNGHLGGLGSLSSVRSRTFLENAVSWAPIVKKYRGLKEAPKATDSEAVAALLGHATPVPTGAGTTPGTTPVPPKMESGAPKPVATPAPK